MENEIHDKLWKLIVEEVDNHVAASYFCIPPAKKSLEHGLTKAKPSPSKNEVQESIRKKKIKYKMINIHHAVRVTFTLSSFSEP